MSEGEETLATTTDLINDIRDWHDREEERFLIELPHSLNGDMIWSSPAGNRLTGGHAGDRDVPPPR